MAYTLATQDAVQAAVDELLAPPADVANGGNAPETTTTTPATLDRRLDGHDRGAPARCSPTSTRTPWI